MSSGVVYYHVLLENGENKGRVKFGISIFRSGRDFWNGAT